MFDYFNCAQCGYKSGEWSPAERRRYRDEHGAWPPRRHYFEVCPLKACGGEVGWCAWEHSHRYALGSAR